MASRSGRVVSITSVLLAGLGLALAGCGDSGRTETGTVVQKAPGQDEGQQKSIDAMKAMMKGGGGAKK